MSTWLTWWLNWLFPLALAKEKGGLLGGGGELEKLQEISMLPLISHPNGALQASHSLNDALDWPSYLRPSLGEPSPFIRGLQWPSDQKVSCQHGWQQLWEALAAQHPSLPLSLGKMIFVAVARWVQEIHSGMFLCSSRHVSTMGGLLGHTLRPIASCSPPITHPTCVVLVIKPTLLQAAGA